MTHVKPKVKIYLDEKLIGKYYSSNDLRNRLPKGGISFSSRVIFTDDYNDDLDYWYIVQIGETKEFPAIVTQFDFNGIKVINIQRQGMNE